MHRGTELRVAQEEARKKGLEPQFVEIDKPDPSVLFSPRFLSIAAKDPQSPDAIEALRMTLISSNDHVTGAVYETRAKAVEILERLLCREAVDHRAVGISEPVR